MVISLILASDERGAIGYKNQLLYHIKEDMNRFRNITTYNEHGLKNFVVMGKNTFHSLKQPLKNRCNVILTTDNKYTVDDKQVIVAHSLENVINQYLSGKQCKELFIIGGQSIYEQSIQYADKVYLTLIHDSGKKADTYFNLDLLNEFYIEDIENHYSEEYQCEYDFITYKRKKGAIE